MSRIKQRINIGNTSGSPFEFETDGVSQRADKTWYRGEHCNFNPTRENMRSVEAVPKHLLAGWVPAAPSITPHTNIVSFGSCFAVHIADWLAKRDFSLVNHKDGQWGETYIARFGEGMVNTYAILQQFEWALEGVAFIETLWHGKDATSYGYDEDIRLQTQAALMASDFFIITLGLSEVWAERATGDVFWRAIPKDEFDPEKHQFRVSTHSENLANLRRIYQLIRKHRPDAKIMFTLSPVPLVATFRPVSCLTANAASKAILRAALDEFLSENQPDDPDLHYWPSYEIIMDVFGQPWGEDRRHVKPKILDYVMTLFEHTWCTGTPQMGLSQAWVRARCAQGGLPRKVYNLMEAGKFDQARQVVSDWAEAEQDLVATACAEMQARQPGASLP